jgi:hypothetical protein
MEAVDRTATVGRLLEALLDQTVVGAYNERAMTDLRRIA